MSVLHIVARDIMRHDAVGTFCTQVARLARTTGREAQLWAENTNLAGDEGVKPIERLFAAVSAGDTIFYNHSIFDPNMARIAALDAAKAYYFHNITPPALFDDAHKDVAANCRKGLDQIGAAGTFDILMANSNYSADVLRAGLGREQPRDILICPPEIILNGTPRSSAPGHVATDGKRHLLCVGRLTPHKGHHDLLAVFEALANLTGEVALDIVGGPASGPYPDQIKARAQQIERETGAPIRFFHDIGDAELGALYDLAHLCLSFSRHEGFGLPAADALAHDRPMFCTPLPALRDVLGAAYHELSPDTPEASAKVLLEALRDPGFAQKGRAARQEALARHRRAANGEMLKTVFTRLEAD